MKPEIQTYSNGGYWMVAGLVALLMLPPVIGHFVMKTEVAPSLHAEASVK